MEKRKILLVNERAWIFKSLKKTLEEQDCRVYTAKNNQEAIEMFKNHQPDICAIGFSRYPYEVKAKELFASIRLYDSQARLVITTAEYLSPDQEQEALSLGEDYRFIRHDSFEGIEELKELLLTRAKKEFNDDEPQC